MKSAYARRDTLLMKLGFRSYQDYLASDLWRGIRAEVLKRDSNRCVICAVYAFIVHHLDYKVDTLFGSTISGLVTVCGDCHRRVEFKRSGQKRTLTEARNTYKRLTVKAKKPVRKGRQVR